MSTIRDVARLAGVSVSTVSYALNGKRPISPRTRERILAAARSLDYQPNNMAKSLKTGRTMTLGLIIPDILNPFFTMIARVAEDEASSLGYSLVLCNSCNDAAREQGYLDLLRSRRVDGLIYMAGSSVPHASLRSLLDQGFPVVLIDEELEGIDTSTVVVRNYEGSVEVAEHLATLGHRQIGIIIGPLALRTAQSRLSGAIAGLARYGIMVRPEDTLSGDYQVESGRSATRRLLTRNPRITAIFAANDMMAIGALQEAQAAGLRVPHDLSIAGFDDVPLASMVVPALTTVAQPTEDMARQAIQLLIAQMRKRRGPVEHIVFDTRLRLRDSTAAPRATP